MTDKERLAYARHIYSKGDIIAGLLKWDFVETRWEDDHNSYTRVARVVGDPEDFHAHNGQVSTDGNFLFYQGKWATIVKKKKSILEQFKELEL
jgi:hypothetical protein